MKKFMIAAAVLSIACSAATAQTEDKHFQYEEAIQVSGRAEKKITPDEIYMNIVIRDGDVKNQNVNQIESTVKSRLKSFDIDVEKNFRVNDMANAPKKRNQVDTKRSYELKVGDVWTLNAVFEMLGELGVSDANVTRVSHSRMDDFRREVRVEAIKTARENARQLAEAIGQSIGSAVWIVDSGNMYEDFAMPVTRSVYKMAAGSVYGEGTAETGLDFKDITLNYHVTAKFILNRQ